MAKIHIMCDSPSDVTYEESMELGIEVLPVIISWEGRDYREGVDISRQDYYEVLKRCPEIPSTTLITPIRFLESYIKAYENGCTHLICVTISAAASGTFTSATVARDMFMADKGENAMKIEVLDSKGYTLMYGAALKKAAEMRNKGEDFDTIVNMLRECYESMEALFLVYSLKQFKKSGRISGAASFVGEALGLRPIAHIAGGKINVIDKVRGDKNVLPATMKLLKKFKDPDLPNHFIVVYAETPMEEVETCESLIKENFPGAVIEKSDLGPCIVTNTGPNVLGIIYRGKKFIE